jgi:hypothetical protein
VGREPAGWFYLLCVGGVHIGLIVFLGYGFEIIESLHRHKDSRYPDFDMNRLMDYLLRGLWVFLVRLVAGIPVGMIVAFLYIAVWVATAAAPDKYRGIVLGIGLPLFFIVVLLLSMAVSLVIVPLTLRAGLTQDFGQAFSLAFIKDFIKRVWLETILQGLFMAATGFVLMLAGLLLCFIGIYPAAALMTFAEFHLLYQLYELYLERGGTPIPLKEKPALPDEDVDAMPIAEPAPESFKAAEE